MGQLYKKDRGANWQQQQFNAKIATGVIVIGFGTLILLGRLGYSIPNWLVSWQTILISIGAVTLIKHNFRKLSGYILMGIGFIFLIKKFNPEWIDTRLILPAVLIIIGLSVLYKAIIKNRKKQQSRREFSGSTEGETLGQDTFESNAIFGGVEKIVTSKSLRKAEINSVFGGNEVNFMQADFNGIAEVEANAVFGGVTLIIPSNWSVRSDELSTFAGSIEDKRPNFGDIEDENKTLILKGACVFGGIEIRTNR